jgi:hypothetical protein
MERREGLLREMADVVRKWVREDVAGSALEPLGMRVEAGGRVGNFGPVPWVRIYSPRHSPRPTEGFYVVWLFGATGHSVYLSVNQGTSEWRSNKMRPIQDARELSGRAATAREVLAGEDALLLPQAVRVLDLRVDELPVGREAKLRVHNYEYANVAGIEYRSRAIPADDELRADLTASLSLLSRLYDVGLPEQAPSAALARRSGRQGRLTKAARDAVEQRAMTVATELYLDEGFDVEDVSARMEFDLRCTRGTEEIHVECKGTTGHGEEIVLTRNEVTHAQVFPNCGLVIVRNIELDATDLLAPKASGGDIMLVDPWTIDPARLTPTQYVYHVHSKDPA